MLPKFKLNSTFRCGDLFSKKIFKKKQFGNCLQQSFFLHFGEILHLKKKALFHIVGNFRKFYKFKSRFWRLKKIQGICDIIYFAKIFFRKMAKHSPQK
jgi:predicted amino acid racemase